MVPEHGRAVGGPAEPGRWAGRGALLHITTASVTMAGAANHEQKTCGHPRPDLSARGCCRRHQSMAMPVPHPHPPPTPPGDERAGGTALEDGEGVGECWGRLLAEERPSGAQGPCAGGRRCPCPQLRAVSRLQLSAQGRGAQRTRPARHPTAPWGRGTLQNWPDHGTVQGRESKRPPPAQEKLCKPCGRAAKPGLHQAIAPGQGLPGQSAAAFWASV